MLSLSAYKYNKIFSSLSDSILNYQKLYALEDLTEKYQTEAGKNALERQNERLSRQHEQNVMLFLSGLFILLLIIIILFLNRQRLTNRNKYERSENEKLKIELTLHQKDLSDAALEIVRSNNAYGGLLHDVEQIGRTAKGDNRRFFRQIIIGQKMLSQEETWRQFNI